MVTLVALSLRTTLRGPFLDPNGICYLEPVAARAFEALDRAAVAELGAHIPVTEAGRTGPRQNYLFQGWMKRLPGFYLALPQGASIHEKYRAIDFGGPFAVIGSREHDWLVKRGPQFGWIWTGAHFTHIEGWHFEHNGLQVAANAATASTPLTSTPTEEDDMPKNFRNADGTVFTLGETYGIIWTDPNSFSYQTNMALSPQIAINITPDQIKTAVGEANGRGAALRSVTNVNGAAIDYAALAKAVNDDAAARLAN